MPRQELNPQETEQLLKNWDILTDSDFEELAKGRELAGIIEDRESADSSQSMDELPQHHRELDNQYFKMKRETCGYCGRFSLHGTNARESRFLRVGCKTWGCKHCGPRKAARYKHSIRKIAEKLNLSRMLTLTLDPKKLGTAEQSEQFMQHLENAGRCECDDCNKLRVLSVRHLRDSFNKFRTYMRRKYGESIKYVAVLEFQPNKTGLAHLHLLIDRYMEQSWCKQAWELLGGGQHVDVRAVGLNRVSRYLAKYLTKDLLMSAPKRARRITCSRGISLNEKPEKTHSWVLVKTNLHELLRRNIEQAEEINISGPDDDLVLNGFLVRLN